MKRDSNEENLGNLINRYLKSIDRGGNFLRAKVLGAWQEMGPPVTTYTKNLFYREGTLYVQISSAALKSELNMNKKSLIKRLNESVGEEAVFEVIFR